MASVADDSSPEPSADTSTTTTATTSTPAAVADNSDNNDNDTSDNDANANANASGTRTPPLKHHENVGRTPVRPNVSALRVDKRETAETFRKRNGQEMDDGHMSQFIKIEDFMTDFVPGGDLPRPAKEYYDFAQVPASVFEKTETELYPYIVRLLFLPQHPSPPHSPRISFSVSGHL